MEGSEFNQNEHYATPDTVAMTLGLHDRNDPMSRFKFSDESNPTYDFVCDLIEAAEDEIDRRTKRSWRVNRVKNYITDLPQWQWDENGYRAAEYANGGREVQLQRNLLPWDPTEGDRI